MVGLFVRFFCCNANEHLLGDLSSMIHYNTSFNVFSQRLIVSSLWWQWSHDWIVGEIFSLLRRWTLDWRFELRVFSTLCDFYCQDFNLVSVLKMVCHQGFFICVQDSLIFGYLPWTMTLNCIQVVYDSITVSFLRTTGLWAKYFQLFFCCSWNNN